MTTSLRLSRCLSRRHFARISISDMFGESSMNSGASDTRPIVDARRVQSSSRIVPLRMCCSWIPASADSSRMVISVLLISSEKITEARLCLMEALRTMSKPRVDFPIAGLAARTII